MEKAIEALSRKGPSGTEVADWIRSQIRASRFVPGQRLVEVDIIRKTGGSRFKVREALQRLAAEGLVEIEEYRGASVKGASMSEIRQLYRSRAALEGLCAADFTRIATQAQRDRLRVITQDMERCIDEGSTEMFGKLNAEFHTMLMQVPGNDVIQDLVKRLNTPVHHLLFESFYRGDRMREAVADHWRIVEAIDAGDCAAAEREMRRHIENGHRVLEALDQAMHHDG